jgi:hypothetical protein
VILTSKENHGLSGYQSRFPDRITLHVSSDRCVSDADNVPDALELSGRNDRPRLGLVLISVGACR